MKMIETAAMFVAICYGPWFLKSYVTEKSTANDLLAFKQAFIIKSYDSELGNAILQSMQRQSWYLTEELCILALADDDVNFEVKKEMMMNLLSHDMPETFACGKPALPVIYDSTTLVELVGERSWNLLKLLEISPSDLKSWIEEGKVGQEFEYFGLE